MSRAMSTPAKAPAARACRSLWKWGLGAIRFSVEGVEGVDRLHEDLVSDVAGTGGAGDVVGPPHAGGGEESDEAGVHGPGLARPEGLEPPTADSVGRCSVR